jgi:hypothetical protein
VLGSVARPFVVQTAVAHGGNLTPREVKGAIGALADNTSQLGAAIGSVYGPAAQAQFLKLWRAHIGFFVNYTLGVATHNPAKTATVAGKPSASAALLMAENHMAGTGAILAQGIAASMPSKFGS